MTRYVGIMYKIKSLLPQKARLQIFHSFVQSHLNFCSVVWGFSAKSHIESLFVAQKKGMRSVMPGYINYFFKDGCLPTHTKPAFAECDVLTVHGVIVKNSLTFIHKAKNFPTSMPTSVKDTIASNAPDILSNYESCKAWLDEYGTTIYNNSIFFKGPLLYNQAAQQHDQLTSPMACLSYKCYKNIAKRVLLGLQKQGDGEEWQGTNFLLYNVQGLRKSARLNS